MKINSLKGMNDYLPAEADLRDYLQSTILRVYKENGFSRVITPIIEDIENLDKSEGGDNLNLIFKILKRGDKLEKAIEEQKFDELSDMGLRYDLTLPLSRYFANNRANLLTPFKCIQIDKVYRAERPQKGRLRELTQCDIDILGSDSYFCEIELIDVTAKALLEIGLSDFKVRINDRRILKELLLSFGFDESEIASVCISFDKINHIGLGGVEEELRNKEFSPAGIEKFVSFLGTMPIDIDMLPNSESIENLQRIISGVKQICNGKYSIEFDISLVRGQGYYTGTVFEIESNEFKDSIAGGGRYDNLIGKFLGETIPAVGFSIGFERIFCILSERNSQMPKTKKRIAFLYDDFFTAYTKAQDFQAEYDVTLFEKPQKLGKFLNRLESQGYYGWITSDELKIFNER
ncbi:MAG: ATP phosphoribosyltransferase regulatory subunit [Oscillospiraceae bacterium]|nr:ATP phosphoribosyltransferase regulatory subunit [Oscillospiraceae bacterium]